MDARIALEAEEIFAAEPNKFSRWGIAILGIVVFAALFAPWISPYDYRVQNMLDTFANPGRTHLLGTDQFGRDILSRIIWGSRASLIVGLEATVLGGILGTFLGMVAGYKGGTIDHVITRLVDMMMAIPTLIMSLMMMVALGPSLHHTALAIAISMTPKFIRLARASSLTLRERDYVLASEALGASHSRLLWRHILPNSVGPIVVMATLWLGFAIRIEATMSFLGLGVQPPNSSWGLMIKEGVDSVLFYPWLALFPGLAIMITILAFNMLGDNLQDILNPRLR